MKTAFKFQKNARKLNVCLIGAIGLIPALISAQFCEPNYSVPYSTINMSVYTEKSINNQYSTFMTVGQPFIVHNESIPTNYAIHSTVTGFWSHYMNEPRPPLVSASDGDFQDIVLVKWVVEDDRTGPPVTGNTVTLYRNGYVLTQLPVEQTEFQDLYVFPGEYYTYGVTSSNTMGTSHTQNDIGFLNPNGVITGYISTPTGAPMLDAKVLLTPNLGQSAEFNGDGYIFFFDDGEVIDGVEIPPANLQFSGLDSSYTIETWFRTVEPGPQAIFSALVPDAEDEQYVYIGLNDAGQVIWQHQSFDADAIAEIVSEDIIPEPGEWHHIALVFNGDDYDMTMYDVNSMTMYLDGDLVDTKESVSSIGPGNDAEILLGKADHVSTTNYFSGYLDDFRLWSVPRSWEDLRKYIDITLSGEETGLEAYWKFDEIEGETIFDLTNNDIDGTICRVEHDNLTAPVYVGALTDATGNYAIKGIYYADGYTFTVTPSQITPIGRSLEFDGNNNYISFENKRINISESFSLEGWFKTKAGQDYPQTIFTGVDPTDQENIQISVGLNENGNVEVALGEYTLTSNDPYHDNLWHHFAVTYTAATETMNLFLRDEPVISSINTLDIADETQTEIVIGRDASNGDAQYFNGFLDEFRVWNVARTANQISGARDVSLVGDESGLTNYLRFNEASGYYITDATGSLIGELEGYESDPEIEGEPELAWSEDIPLNEVFEHYYEPESRQATLNTSNTSVDMVDFIDMSLIPISGYVRYLGTPCFQEDIEILLNDRSLSPPVYTDSDGKFIINLEPGTSGNQISCSYRDHSFIPAYWDLPLITRPISGLYFEDEKTRDISGTIAGGDCGVSIAPVVTDDPETNPDAFLSITLSALDNCWEKTYYFEGPEPGIIWSLDGLPPLTYNVSIHHPAPEIEFLDEVLSLEEEIEEDEIPEYVYYSPLQVEFIPNPDDAIAAHCGDTTPSFTPDGQVSEDIDDIQYIMEQTVPTTWHLRAFEEYTGGYCIIYNFNYDVVDNLTGQNYDGSVSEADYSTHEDCGELPCVKIDLTPMNINTVNTENHPFQRNCAISIEDENDREATDDFWAFVTGGESIEGENLIATTTQEPWYILRVPPGDQSSTTFTSSNKICQKHKITTIDADGNEEVVKTKLGSKVQLGIGLGAITITEVEVVNEIEANFNQTTTDTESDEILSCLSTSQSYTAGGNGNLVGDDATVIIGGAEVYTFGMENTIDMVESCVIEFDQITTIEDVSIEAMYLYTKWFIRNSIIPDLEQQCNDPADESLQQTYCDSEAKWRSILDADAQAIADAVESEAFMVGNSNSYSEITLGAGAGYTFTSTIETTETHTEEVTFAEVNDLGNSEGGTINDFGIELSYKHTWTTSDSNVDTDEETFTQEISFSLGDDDPGDVFTVGIRTDPIWGMPAFTIPAGETSCPHEPGTFRRDDPDMLVDPVSQVGIYPDETAYYTVTLINSSVTDAERIYFLRPKNQTNPYGAQLTVNGNAIPGGGFEVNLPGNGSTTAVIGVSRGPEAYDYPGIEFQLASGCDYDIFGATGDYSYINAAVISISTTFLEPCSEVNIYEPEDGWLFTTEDDPENPDDQLLTVGINGYDSNDDNLVSIDLQYRINENVFEGGPSNDSNEISLPSVGGGQSLAQDDLERPGGDTRKNSILTSLEENGMIGMDGAEPEIRSSGWGLAATITKEQIDALTDQGQNYVQLQFNVDPEHNLYIQDGQYQLRAVANCGQYMAQGTSNIINGIIDREAPQVLGSPTPSDGVLDPDDIISITFNEDIDCQEISPGSGHITLYDTVLDEPSGFTFTCGGNMIVIEPIDPYEFLENRTFRAAVGAIKDIYGNALSTDENGIHIAWEFYINRNPITWVGTSIDNIVIYTDETFTTERILMNVGGSNRSYEIGTLGFDGGQIVLNEIPPWLTVFPTSGILPPGVSETITFSMSQEPGAGQYTETIYASGVQGNEPMHVDIRVLCHPPDWVFNPEDYQYTMNIVATVTTEGELSEDEYDVIGVFSGGELRGVQTVQYVPELDPGGDVPPANHPYLVYLTVFSNTVSGDELELVVWDASECNLLGQVDYYSNGSNESQPLVFEENTVSGYPTSPVTFDATNQIVRTIPFDDGWNWFSLNIVPEDPQLSEVLGSLSPSGDDVIRSQGPFSQFVEGTGWLGNLTSINNASMYMINLAEPDTLVITGDPVDFETNPIPINHSWNWLAYTPQLSYNVNDALGNLSSTADDIIKSQYLFSLYMENLNGGIWLGNLNFMVPNEGYMLKASAAQPVDLTYPLPGQILARDTDDSDPVPLVFGNEMNWLVNVSEFAGNMSMVLQVEIDGTILEDPDLLIAAFDGENCRGVTIPTETPMLEGNRAFLTVYGNSWEEGITFKVYSPQRDLIVDMAESVDYSANDVYGTLENPYMLTGTLIPHTPDIPSEFSLGQNYPNPFNPSTTIEYGLPKDAHVSLVIYNISGQRVRTLVDSPMSASYQKADWNGCDDSGRSVPSGIYIYRLSAGSYTAESKMALVK